MYRFYLGDVLMPVAPGELKIKIKNQNKSFTLVSEGELNVLKSPGLSEISFTLLLPHTAYGFAVYESGFKRPDYFLSLFERLKVTRQNFVLTILRQVERGEQLPYKTSMRCALETYTVKESAKDGLDFAVDLTLKQYIPYGVKTLTIKPSESSNGSVATSTEDRDASSKTQADSYTIKSGDTLWDIARTALGDGSRWREVYTLNKAVLDAEAKRHGMPAESGDRWMFSGTVIRLPKK